MNETLLACVWMLGGWVAGLCTAPRDAIRTAPASSLLAVLVIGAYAGPLVGAPAGWRLARAAARHARGTPSQKRHRDSIGDGLA